MDLKIWSFLASVLDFHQRLPVSRLTVRFNSTAACHHKHHPQPHDTPSLLCCECFCRPTARNLENQKLHLLDHLLTGLDALLTIA